MRKNNREELINLMIKIIMISMFSLGAIVFSYPFISDSINNFYDQKMMAKNLDMSNEAVRLESEKRIEELAKLNEAMADKRKSQNIPGIGLVEDPFGQINTKNENPGEAYYKEHLLGAIYIPNIKVSLPVFDTTNDTLLEKGATLLQGTSYPIGGANTHSVITSHSGLAEKRLFTDLERLKEGDLFYVEIGDEVLAYEVFEFNIVLPHEIEILEIREDEDLLTLLTCTPYMINTHRLLVTGKRVDYEPEILTKEIDSVKQYHSNRIYWNSGALVSFLAVSLVWAIRKYQYYATTKKEYALSFKLVNNESNDSLYTLYNFFGGAHSTYTAQSDENAVIDFEFVKGGKYYIAPVSRKQMRFQYFAKVSKNHMRVYYRTGLFRKQRVDNHDN